MYELCLFMDMYKLVYSITGQDYTDNEKSTFSVANEMYTAPPKSHSQVYNVYLHIM